MEGLTDKQRRFCEEYVVDWNATRAAIAAGYSEKTADVQGSRLLGNVKVAEYIDQCKTRTAQLAGISAVQNAVWLREIAASAVENTRDRIKAIEVLNKMEGYDAPTKFDHTTGGDKLPAPVQVMFIGSNEELPQSEDDIVEPE